MGRERFVRQFPQVALTKVERRSLCFTMDVNAEIAQQRIQPELKTL